MYIGVTNDLKRRLDEHKNGLVEGFTKKYHCHKLVYYEKYSYINAAISREKELKHRAREKKNLLVESINTDWNELPLL